MHENVTAASGLPAPDSEWRPPRDRGASGRPGRDLALVAMIVGAGAVWLWSHGPRRRRSKRRPDMPTLAAGRGRHVERTMTIRRAPDEVYRAWRDLEAWPRLLPERLASVTVLAPRQSRWRMTGPGGVTMSWDAELTADEPGRLLAWRSAPGADVDIAGSVRFTPAPAGRGTEVKVIATYAPPGGKLGAAAAALFGQNGDRLVREALRRFKQLMETGENSTATAAPDAKPGMATSRLARSA